MSLNQSDLMAHLSYDKNTGVFTRNIATCGRVKVGQVAGSVDAYGYTIISVLSERYKAHRLAWLYVFGEMPSGQVDHINGIKIDNRIANLRCVSHSENMQNKYDAHRNSSTGFLGVFVKGKGFASRISKDGKSHFLGCFTSADAASYAYSEAKKKLHIQPTP